MALQIKRDSLAFDTTCSSVDGWLSMVAEKRDRLFSYWKKNPVTLHVISKFTSTIGHIMPELHCIWFKNWKSASISNLLCICLELPLSTSPRNIVLSFPSSLAPRSETTEPVDWQRGMHKTGRLWVSTSNRSARENVHTRSTVAWIPKALLFSTTDKLIWSFLGISSSKLSVRFLLYRLLPCGIVLRIFYSGRKCIPLLLMSGVWDAYLQKW